jgi:hypothetical protein
VAATGRVLVNEVDSMEQKKSRCNVKRLIHGESRHIQKAKIGAI